MTILTAEGLSKAFGDRVLFEGVRFGISREDRVGLIGVNGSGKSTLLKILMGKMEPDEGEVNRAKGARIEYLSQRPGLDPSHSAMEAVLAEGPQAFEVVQSYEEACRRLEANPQDEEVLQEVTRLSEVMDRVKGWTLESEAKRILSQLGIDDAAMAVSSMSGGQQKRVALARALIRPADLLILDEPTNHLDVDVIAWLEGYLARRTSGLLLITHDRYFLDRVTNMILELADQRIYRHRGNYSDFIEAREKRHEELRKKEQKRSKLAKKELEWLRRGPKARGTKAKARIKRAKKLINTSYEVDEQSVEIDTVERRLGKKVIAARGVTKRRDGRTLIEDFDYHVDRRDRLGIVGPNGVGKSTLLDLLAGRLEPDEGEVERGSTVEIGYYDQRTQGLDPTQRVHDYVSEVAHRVPTSDGWMTASQMLELFLFDKRKQWTYIEKLSGGERRRLYLLRVLMGQPNILFLDEPTNDLDVDTLTVLEDYLDDFEGAVVTVSHDRYFLDRTVEHLLAFGPQGQVQEIPGNYSYYEERLEEERTRRRQKEAERKAEAKKKDDQSARRAKKASSGLSYREGQELARLEERIAQIESRQSELDELMVKWATDFEKVRELDDEKKAIEEEYEEAFLRWMELSEKAEG